MDYHIALIVVERMGADDNGWMQVGKTSWTEARRRGYGIEVNSHRRALLGSI